MNILEIIGVVASVVTIVSFAGSAVHKFLTSKSHTCRRIARKRYKIQELDRQIFILGRDPLALEKINRLEMKRNQLQAEIYELQQNL